MLNKKTVYFIFLLFIAVMLISASIYNYYIKNRITIPECSTTTKVDISDQSSNLKGYYLLSVIPSTDTPNKMVFIMNGEISFNQKNYTISRKFLLDYKLQSDHFFAQIENISIDPSDQAGNNIYIRGIPQINQIYFFRIKQLNENNYLFEENYAPLFICTM